MDFGNHPPSEKKMKEPKSLKALSMLSSLVIVRLSTIAPMAAEDVPRVTKEVRVRYLDNAEI
jgi:hypothetical protein